MAFEHGIPHKQDPIYSWPSGQITPADGADLPRGLCRAVYVGTSGNLAARDADGNDVVFVGLAAGIWHPMRVMRILATGTTAAQIIPGY